MDFTALARTADISTFHPFIIMLFLFSHFFLAFSIHLKLSITYFVASSCLSTVSSLLLLFDLFYLLTYHFLFIFNRLLFILNLSPCRPHFIQQFISSIDILIYSKIPIMVASIICSLPSCLGSSYLLVPENVSSFFLCSSHSLQFFPFLALPVRLEFLSFSLNK